MKRTPDPTPVQKDPAQEQFESSLASGKKSWKPSRIKLLVKETSSKSKKTKTTDLKCSLKSPIELVGQFPSLEFSMGILDCDKFDRLDSGDRLAFTQIISNLYYKIRKPPGLVDGQFVLNMNTRPKIYLAPHFEIESIRSLNSVVFEDEISLDLLITTEAKFNGMDAANAPQFYMVLKMKAENGFYKSLNISLDIESGDKKTRFELSGILDY